MRKTDWLRKAREARAEAIAGDRDAAREPESVSLKEQGQIEEAPPPEKATSPVADRMGRPARVQPMEQALTVRLGGGERAKLVLAADLAGEALSVWARRVLLEKAGEE